MACRSRCAYAGTSWDEAIAGNRSSARIHTVQDCLPCRPSVLLGCIHALNFHWFHHETSSGDGIIEQQEQTTDRDRQAASKIKLSAPLSRSAAAPDRSPWSRCSTGAA